jgi:hypothetical protein
MTDVDTPPKPRSRTCPAKPEGRSRKIYVLWTIALTLLLSLGAFCWLVVVPVWQVRDVLAGYSSDVLSEQEAIQRLGGPKQA